MTVQSLYEAGRLPHAVLLVAGENDLPLKETIELYNSAPADTVYVKDTMPDGKYKIEPLRKIINSGSLRPHFGDTRLFVFTDFDNMSEICQNALLKFIEEPMEYNKFVLTASSTGKILPTIISRVVKIDVGDVNPDVPPAEITDIVSAIVSALLRESEYGTAAAFTRIKDRQSFTLVLRLLLAELSNIMVNSENTANIIAATDVVQKYIKRMEVNPNVAVMASSCALELFKEIVND
ncbi:MAG: hypothetical protein FWD34_03925 [Oscillospiraceae bacterium]|nr:hypothetical protein [Oscillospiraceae bacterium]